MCIKQAKIQFYCLLVLTPYEFLFARNRIYFNLIRYQCSGPSFRNKCAGIYLFLDLVAVSEI